MRKIATLLGMLLLCASLVIAQTRPISGVVRDAQGNPVPFASVTIRGTSTGVSADANGRFTINANTGDVLVLTAVGLQNTEVTVGSGNSIQAEMVSAGTDDLEEIVVTGAYGTKRAARSVSYNAQIVDEEALNTIRQTNLNSALAGKVSGMQFRGQSTVALGRTGDVRLRGVDGGVIYVVDGTILPNSDGVNLDDIQDITVLQGPAASAQFGPQGGNGAIVITTKRGRQVPGIGVTVNIGAQFDNVYILPNYQNSYAGGASQSLTRYTWQPGHPEEWRALDGKYYHDTQDDASWGPRMVGQEYIPWYAWYGGHSRSYQTATLTPQPDNARDFFNTGVTLNNSVSFTKASELFNVRLSYGNIYMRGMIPNSDLKRNTLNLNSTVNITPKFKVGANINYINTNINGQVGDDNYSNQSTGSFNQWFHRDLDMNIMRELKDLTTPDGIYASWNKANPTGYDATNPRSFYAGNYWYNFFSWFDLVTRQNSANRLYGDLNLTYNITNNLNIKGTYRKQQNVTWTEERFRSELATSGLQTSGNSPETLGYYSSDNTYSDRQNIELMLGYNQKFGDFEVTANAGTDFFKWNYKANGGNTNNGLSAPNLFTLQNSRNPASIRNDRIKEAYNAIFALGNVGFRNFAFVDFSLRNDWFSTLPPDNNDVFSKSVGASLIFSDLLKVPAISYGKIRASWGEIPMALGSSSTTFGAYRYPGMLYGVNQNQWNGNILMGTPDQMVDPNITGAVRTQREIGLELRFLNNRIGLSGTYWDGTEIDAPTSVTLDATTGFTSLLTNFGRITRKGVDVQLMLRPVVSENFNWEINGTWGYLLDNTVVEIAPGVTRTSVEGVWGSTLPYLVHEEGKQWGQIFGNGIKRIDGQPVINADGSYQNDPNVYFGSVLPRYTGGIQNTFQFLKDFTLSANIDFQSGGKFVSLSNMWGSYSGLTAQTATVNDKGNPIRDAVADGGGVHVFGVDEEGKAMDVYMEAQDYFHGLYNNLTFDPFVYSLTYVKLREVSLGYTLPISKLGIGNVVQDATLSVVARNPLLIFAHSADFDPSEISARSGETGQFPGTRGFGFNLRVGF